MSKSFLKVSEAYTKLGLSGGGTSWIRKSELIATGKCDTSLLEKYGNNDFVIDDDIVKKDEGYISSDYIELEFTAGQSSDKLGYYVRRYGTVKVINNTSYCDGFHTFNTINGVSEFYFNTHLRELVPGIYNRIAIYVYNMNGQLENYLTGSLSHSSSDFNSFVDENGMSASQFLLGIVGIKKKFVVYFCKT